MEGAAVIGSDRHAGGPASREAKHRGGARRPSRMEGGLLKGSTSSPGSSREPTRGALVPDAAPIAS